MGYDLLSLSESVATAVEPERPGSAAAPGEWAAPQRRRVLIAAESIVEALGMTAVLDRFTDLHVVRQVQSAPETLRAAADTQPDVVLVGLGPSPDAGLALLRALRTQFGSVPLVAFAAVDSPALRRAAQAAGASSCVPRDADPAQLHAALLPLPTGSASATSAARVPAAAGSDASAPEVLTPREMEVLSLIASGHSSREIARLLGIRLATVNAHRASMMKKLNVHKAVGLAQYWIRRCQYAG